MPRVNCEGEDLASEIEDVVKERFTLLLKSLFHECDCDLAADVLTRRARGLPEVLGSSQKNDSRMRLYLQGTVIDIDAEGRCINVGFPRWADCRGDDSHNIWVRISKNMKMEVFQRDSGKCEDSERGVVFKNRKRMLVIFGDGHVRYSDSKRKKK